MAAAQARRQVITETVNINAQLIQAANASQAAGTHLPGNRTQFDALPPDVQAAWKTGMYCISNNLMI
jgi:hypothetical protein